jgi:hypothetical protein
MHGFLKSKRKRLRRMNAGYIQACINFKKEAFKTF